MSHPFLSLETPIRWSTLTADHIEADITRAIELAEQRLQAIRDLKPEELTYESTFAALEDSSKELNHAWGLVHHLDSVCDHKEQREALNAMLPKVSAFYSSISLDSNIWASLKAFSESGTCKELGAVEKRLVEETCREFIESGADLDEQAKAQVAEVDKELSASTQKFKENTLDSTNAWELVIDDEAQLDGLPKMFKEIARQDALKKGHGSEDEPKWRFTLQFPSYYPVMQHCSNASLRKKIWEAQGTIGYSGESDNSELVPQILKLRQKKAELLGKAHFPDLVTTDRMAKTGQGALDFTENLHSLLHKGFLQDDEDLKAFVAEQTGEKVEYMKPWDVAYWAEKMRVAKFDFDEMKLRPYFEVSKVMKGMFDVFSKIFGTRIVEVETCFGGDKEGCVQVWHEECTYYDLFDVESGTKLGSFYADWHPRESKGGGAWMNSLVTGGRQKDGSHAPHVALIIGNMTKPSGDQPALLDHREVETIFHEFGHLLHHLLGEVSIKSLAGTSVPRDFVELPSQILENWCWDREALGLFARHYETGEPIPDELFDKMIAAKNFRNASVFMTQLAYGKADLEIHLNVEKYADRDLDEVTEEILKGYRIETPIKSPSLYRKFNHLFSGPEAYAAGYYSYKWSEVLDADAFTKFKEEGIMNQETGMAFRKEILAVGNSRPVDESYRAFMGRDPQLEALLERSGIS